MTHWIFIKQANKKTNHIYISKNKQKGTYLFTE